MFSSVVRACRTTSKNDVGIRIALFATPGEVLTLDKLKGKRTSVSTILLNPSLPTERKQCPDLAARHASTAISKLPSVTSEHARNRIVRRDCTCRIFEADWHTKCACEFAVYLRFSCPGSNGTPCRKVSKVLRSDCIYQSVSLEYRKARVNDTNPRIHKRWVIQFWIDRAGVYELYEVPC